MLCKQCNRDFPDDLVQPMAVNAEYVPCCAICALDYTRKVHGMPDYMFTGPRALALYERCVAHVGKTTPSK